MEYVVLFILLLCLSAFFSSSETAFLTLQRVRLEHYVREGRPGAAAVAALLKTPGRLLSAILIGNNLVNTGAAIVGGIIAQSLVSGGLGALIAALTVTLLLVVFGEVGPKTVALQHSWSLSNFYVWPMRLWARLVQPISAVLEQLTLLLMRLTGGGEREGGEAISEEELRTMIGLGAESGSLPAYEAELLHRVFQFGERRVHEAMVPRTEVVWVSSDMLVREFYSVFSETPHSRFPVFEGSPDNVIGIVGIKELLRALAKGEIRVDDPITKIMGPAFFVPESMLTVSLFREMQAQGHQMAVAVDEWGGTAGIVTIETLMEEMVGQIRDELGPAPVETRTIDEMTLEISGSMDIEECREELGLEIPEGSYNTIAGYVMSVLGHIPQVGEFVVLGDRRITVIERRGNKIESLRVTQTIVRQPALPGE